MPDPLPPPAVQYHGPTHLPQIKINPETGKVQLVEYTPGYPMTMWSGAATLVKAKCGFVISAAGDTGYWQRPTGVRPVFLKSTVDFGANYTGTIIGNYSYNQVAEFDPTDCGAFLLGALTDVAPNTLITSASGSASQSVPSSCSATYSTSGWTNSRCSLPGCEGVDSPPICDTVDLHRCASDLYVSTHLAHWINADFYDHATGFCSYHLVSGGTDYTVTRDVDIQLSNEYLTGDLIDRALEDLGDEAFDSLANCAFCAGGLDENGDCPYCIAFTDLSGDETEVTVQAIKYKFIADFATPAADKTLKWDEVLYPYDGSPPFLVETKHFEFDGVIRETDPFICLPQTTPGIVRIKRLRWVLDDT